MTSTQWVRVMDAARLGADKARTIKTHGKQIALFRAGAGDGDIQAIDNRCPHEGYPLSTGMLKDGVLTCEWHNWKFRLCDGVCLLGGEDVRHYPLRVEDGGIWLDLGDPPASAATPGMYASLEHAFEEGDWGHAGRTIERLLEAGEQPGALLGFGCDWAARHAPYGFDHGLAAAADIAAMVPLFEGEPGIPLLEALNLMVEPNLRRPPRQWPEPEPVPVDGSADWKLIEVELRRRIEAEDLAGAEALPTRYLPGSPTRPPITFSAMATRTSFASRPKSSCRPSAGITPIRCSPAWYPRSCTRPARIACPTCASSARSWPGTPAGSTHGQDQAPVRRGRARARS
jgi:nitrite reductase/ring-hydroxylating ferredoxin subunit